LQVYGAFSVDYQSWLEAVKIIAEIDCLVSLASASSALGEPAVRPEIIDARNAFVEFEELRHPCVVSATSDFIPNEVKLGGDEKKMVLLTGPNVRR
jgi:DNA mismatch repair protein MSH6